MSRNVVILDLKIRRTIVARERQLSRFTLREKRNARVRDKKNAAEATSAKVMAVKSFSQQK